MRKVIRSNSSIAALLTGLMLGSVQGAYSESADGKTVRREDVKTWVLTLDGKDHEAHPMTPAYDGSTGLFHLPSAYTLPKGRLSVSLFRDNLDRDPKDQDISIHGLTAAFGVTNRLSLIHI